MLLLVTLCLVGCGPRIGGGAMATHLNDAPFAVDLPALYISYDQSGVASVGSVPLVDLGAALGLDLARLDLDADQLQWIIDANIQHIQVTSLPEQLLILINGRPVPSPIWNADSLGNGADALRRLDSGLAEVTRLLPTLAEIGGGVVLRFPLASGAAAIPLVRLPSDFAAGTSAQATYLDIIGTPPQLMLDVIYQEDGRWTVDGLDASAWVATLSLPWDRLDLSSDTLRRLRAGGIDEFVLRSDQQGIFIEVNGNPLPHLTWADGELLNLIVLATDGGILTQLVGDSPTAYSLASTVERLLPMVMATEIQLRVYFPVDTTTN